MTCFSQRQKSGNDNVPAPNVSLKSAYDFQLAFLYLCPRHEQSLSRLATGPKNGMKDLKSRANSGNPQTHKWEKKNA